MKDISCELCNMMAHEKTMIYLDDGEFVYGECPKCGIPIIVYKTHGNEPSKELIGKAQANARTIWRNAAIVDGQPHNGNHWYRHIYI